MTDHNKNEIYVLYLEVLYLDPNRRREGIDTKLLKYITEVQVEKGLTEQWVSVQKGDYKGIPFNEAMDFTKESEKLAYSNESESGKDYIFAENGWGNLMLFC